MCHNAPSIRFKGGDLFQRLVCQTAPPICRISYAQQSSDAAIFSYLRQSVNKQKYTGLL